MSLSDAREKWAGERASPFKSPRTIRPLIHDGASSIHAPRAFTAAVAPLASSRLRRGPQSWTARKALNPSFHFGSDTQSPRTVAADRLPHRSPPPATMFPKVVPTNFRRLRDRRGLRSRPFDERHGYVVLALRRHGDFLAWGDTVPRCNPVNDSTLQIAPAGVVAIATDWRAALHDRGATGNRQKAKSRVKKSDLIIFDSQLIDLLSQHFATGKVTLTIRSCGNFRL